jgi:hypothetical protein
VQYYWQHLSGQMPGSKTIRSLWRKAPAAATRFFRRKGRPGERRSIPLAGQVSGKMIASGWQTAPPQALGFEVVSVTNSACARSFEASLRVTDLHRAAPPVLFQNTVAAELFTHLAPVIGIPSRASAPLILSATTVSRT